MKIRHTTGSGQEKIELQMTPMIDIVFQLLIFFIMSGTRGPNRFGPDPVEVGEPELR